MVILWWKVHKTSVNNRPLQRTKLITINTTAMNHSLSHTATKHNQHTSLLFFSLSHTDIVISKLTALLSLHTQSHIQATTNCTIFFAPRILQDTTIAPQLLFPTSATIKRYDNIEPPFKSISIWKHQNICPHLTPPSSSSSITVPPPIVATALCLPQPSSRTKGSQQWQGCSQFTSSFILRHNEKRTRISWRMHSFLNLVVISFPGVTTGSLPEETVGSNQKLKKQGQSWCGGYGFLSLGVITGSGRFHNSYALLCESHLLWINL
jgi:hypothetical protein